MTCEELGEVTKWSYTLSPREDDTLQIGSIIIYPFEKAFCETIPENESRVVVSHTEMNND